VELGVDVDPEQAVASYQDGILRIELPVAQERRKTTEVPISSGRKRSDRS
jgi:HSP20 family molecular chaperone IbpA